MANIFYSRWKNFESNLQVNDLRLDAVLAIWFGTTMRRCVAEASQSQMDEEKSSF